MTRTKRTTMLAHDSRDESLVTVITKILTEPAIGEWTAKVKYDQIIALHEARKALRRKAKR